ncbi:hypothetical protein VDGL01_08281 [Verticillium dahliae]
MLRCAVLGVGCAVLLSLSLSFAVKLRGIPCSAPAIPFITSSYLRRPSIIGRPVLLLLGPHPPIAFHRLHRLHRLPEPSQTIYGGPPSQRTHTPPSESPSTTHPPLPPPLELGPLLFLASITYLTGAPSIHP